MPISNSARFLRDSLADPYHGAERPRRKEGQGKRNEIRKRRLDAVIPAGEIVPELVGAKDCQDGEAVPEPVQQHAE